jgi:hypothetical protein
LVAAAGPVRTRRPGRTLAAVALASLAGAAALLLGAWGPRPDLGDLPRLPLVLHALAGLAAFGAQLALALVPPRGEVLPAAARGAGWAAAVTAVMVVMGLYAGTHANAGGAAAPPGGDPFWSRALACLATGAAVAAVPGIAGALALGRLAALGAWRPLVALGGAAGVLSGLVLHLHCPVSTAAHVGLAHAPVAALPPALAALAGLLRFGR